MDYTDLIVLGLLFIALQAGVLIDITGMSLGRYLSKDEPMEPPSGWSIIASGALFVGITYAYAWYRGYYK